MSDPYNELPRDVLTKLQRYLAIAIQACREFQSNLEDDAAFLEGDNFELKRPARFQPVNRIGGQKEALRDGVQGSAGLKVNANAYR